MLVTYIPKVVASLGKTSYDTILMQPDAPERMPERIYGRHLVRRPLESLVAFTAPVHARIKASPTTIHALVQQSPTVPVWRAIAPPS